VLRKKRRGQSTNAYHINWRLLGCKFQEFESRVTNVTFLKRGYKNLDLGSPEPCTSEVQNLVPEPIKRTHEENPLPERVSQPSADVTNIDSFLSEKGIQREPVGKPSPSTQSTEPPGGPSRAGAETAVSGYCTAFDWEHLSQEAYEAAITAEIEAPGAGFAVVKAASQEAWRAKRKGVVNG
jgi:hypothetical protein